MTTLLDLILDVQLLLLLQYLLYHMEHHLHTELLLRLCLHSRLCQLLWRTSHLWLRLACRKSLAEIPQAQIVLQISCAIWHIGAR